MTTELFIWVLSTNVITLLLSSIFYATRLDDLRRDHVEHIQHINADTMMQRQVYGQVSMEQLIGLESFDGEATNEAL